MGGLIGMLAVSSSKKTDRDDPNRNEISNKGEGPGQSKN
jgi:hypothetical protein